MFRHQHDRLIGVVAVALVQLVGIAQAFLVQMLVSR